MSTNIPINAELRITSVRSRGPFGGVIFAGKDNSGITYVVRADFALAPDPSLFEIAQIWSVTGICKPVSYVHQGSLKTETHIEPSSLALQRPSGKNIVNWIAQSPDCKSIGNVRARKLYERFGNDLVVLIETGNVDSLMEVVDAPAAEALVAAFAKHGIAETLVWLEQMGMPKSIASSVASYWGKDGRNKVEENPYVLVSFCANWRHVDQLARLRFNIQPSDRRRLIAASEDVLYRGTNNGNTALPIRQVESRLQTLLGSSDLARVVSSGCKLIQAAIEN